MKKTIKEIDKKNEELIQEYKLKFHEQGSFSPFRGVEKSERDFRLGYRHTANLIFIRAKFLFLGTLNELEDNNAFAAFAILKSYWETVAALGYFTLKIEKLLFVKNYDEIVILSRKFAMGGKKYPTEEMIINKGDLLENFQIPNVLTMMEKIDKDFYDEKSKTSFSNEYNLFIAEAGHPTFLGLFPGERKLADGSSLPDISKSGDIQDKKTILNYIVLSNTIFFYYWGKINKL